MFVGRVHPFSQPVEGGPRKSKGSRKIEDFLTKGVPLISTIRMNPELTSPQGIHCAKLSVFPRAALSTHHEEPNNIAD